MNTYELITRKFTDIGARFRVHAIEGGPRWIQRPQYFNINVDTDRKGEYFNLLLGEEPVEFLVPHLDAKDHHLVLMAKVPAFAGAEELRWKFLCGHDERHWFVVGILPNIAGVDAAKESLKPDEVRLAQTLSRLRGKKRHSRNNAAFRRQGEWFFIPAPELQPDEKAIHYQEPGRKGNGSPRCVDQLYRLGGTTVYVCHRYPNGLEETEYARLLKDEPETKKYNWQPMARNPEVYGRGRVRHSDHKTIVLPFWHRIVMNEEYVPDLPNVPNPNVFLD